MKGFDKIVSTLWTIGAITFYIQGVIGGITGEDYIKPFLEAICCTALAILYKIKEKEDD